MNNTLRIDRDQTIKDAIAYGVLPADAARMADIMAKKYDGTMECVPLTDGQPRNILRFHIDRGGGVIAGPQRLGIMVGDDFRRCPPGWLFIHIDDAKDWSESKELEVLTILKSGRSSWPEQGN